ncbi:MAG: PaaI family thioesterase [Oscillospiraceae bacterium]|nr:PaaI family thioesterase [Oscillospiraceae bacterium]
MDKLAWAQEFFKDDGYSVKTNGIVIEEVEPDYAVCSMKVDEKHKNRNGVVMGGAIFTLADFAFAVASNAAHVPTVTLNANITYLVPAVCEKLTAKALCERSGLGSCAFRVEVTDEKGTMIAVAAMTGYRKQ